MQYFETLTEDERAGYKDVTINDLHHLDKLFGISTLVYALQLSDRGQLVTTPVHRPANNLTKKEVEQVMKLNLFDRHFSFLKDIKKYYKVYSCQRSRKVFPKDYKLTCHERGCKVKVKYAYLGGVYTPLRNIFDKLEEKYLKI